MIPRKTSYAAERKPFQASFLFFGADDHADKTDNHNCNTNPSHKIFPFLQTLWKMVFFHLRNIDHLFRVTILPVYVILYIKLTEKSNGFSANFQKKQQFFVGSLFFRHRGLPGVRGSPPGFSLKKLQRVMEWEPAARVFPP